MNPLSPTVVGPLGLHANDWCIIWTGRTLSAQSTCWVWVSSALRRWRIPVREKFSSTSYFQWALPRRSLQNGSLKGLQEAHSSRFPNRPHPPPEKADLAVFANIHDDLSSSDVQYFQTIHGHPSTSPSLKTLYKCEGNQAIDQLMQNRDDLALPEVTGNPIPASATDPRSKADGTCTSRLYSFRTSMDCR